jgi:hypothetical protein
MVLISPWNKPVRFQGQALRFDFNNSEMIMKIEK